MLNRKETYRKKKKTVLLKFVIAAVSTIMILGGTLTVSFANEDLNKMLTNWFDEKRNDAIVNIKNAVSGEKEVQKERLRAEMKKEMDAAAIELDKITAAEKALRIQNLRDYTDKLISEIDIDNSEAEQEMKNQLNSIYAEAKKALDTANVNWKNSVAPVKPPLPAPVEKPEEPTESVEPAKPKAEEQVVVPETPVEPAEDPAPPADEEPVSDDSAPEGDGQ